MTTSTSHALDVLHRVVERWNADDLDGYLTLYHQDAVLHGYDGVGPGFENIRAFYQSFFAAFPGSRLTVDDVFAAGDKVACRFTVFGKHDGPFQGMPPTGRTFSLPGITILRFSGEHCVERWSQANFLALLQQLGAIAPTPPR